MGFPVGYSDLLFPKMLIHFFTILGFFRKLMYSLLSILGIGDLEEFETVSFPVCINNESVSVSANLIREFLPVVKFSELDGIEIDNCAVCLYEFKCEDEIRQLANCRHVFHRSCVDRWMDCDQKTCPLCRTQLIPEDMQETFNERLWIASGISDFLLDGY